VESLEAAVLRPQTGIADQEFFPDLFTKAAALLDSLIQRHPFVDGNKRTGMIAMSSFLRQNGWALRAAPLNFEDFAVYVAVSKPSIDEIASWIRDNSKPHP
jgi:death on curing protein